MMKKITALLLAFVMLAGTALAGFENFTKTSTYSAGQFTDVSSSDWFSENVIAAYELGLVKGSSDKSFNPKGNITVAETVALAVRLHNIYNGGSAELVQGSPWYQVYVDYATKNKIITTKYSDYNAKISRANFAYIMKNALPDDALSAINDVADNTLPDVADDYRAKAIYALYRAGVLTGNDEFGTFNPNSTITRAEVAAIITRMADKAQRKRFALAKKGEASAEIYRGAVAYADTIFEANYGLKLSDSLDENIGYGMTGADMLKQQAFSMITEFEAARLYSVENGIVLSDADKKELAAAKEAQYKAVGGREAFLASLAASGMNEAFYDYVSEGQMYYTKASNLFADGGKYAVDTSDVADILTANYVRVKHILIQANPESENYKEKEALAKQILQKISRGGDFEKLLAEYGEDPGMTYTPDGYLIDKNGYTPEGNQMVEEFAIASNSLKAGEVSDIVTTAYGFHIIKRYPMDKAFTDSFIAGNKDAFKENSLTNTLMQYAEKVIISNREELEKIDIKSVFEK